MTQTIIQCICTVLTVVLTMATMGSKFIKSNVTKEDLKPINDSLISMNQKIDNITNEQNSMRERVVVAEYQIKELLHATKANSLKEE